MMENDEPRLAFGGPVNDYSMTMTTVPCWITGDLIVGKIVDRAEHVLLVGRVLVGVEVAGQSLYL